MWNTRNIATGIALILVSLLAIDVIQVQSSTSNGAVAVASPDGAIEVRFTIREKQEPYPPGRRLYYAVSYLGRDIILDSPLGLDFQNMPPLARDLAVKGTSRRSINETWTPVIASKRSNVINHFNELRLDLEEASPPHRRLALVCRAYDDGVAFRYVLLKQREIGEFRITS